jgi:hypothetical protein
MSFTVIFLQFIFNFFFNNGALELLKTILTVGRNERALSKYPVQLACLIHE